MRRIATANLKGSVELASLLAKPHTYAIGMPDGLNKEILVIDSKAYTSYFDQNLVFHIEEDVKDLSIAFLFHANVPEWKKILIPDNVESF